MQIVFAGAKGNRAESGDIAPPDQFKYQISTL